MSQSLSTLTSQLQGLVAPRNSVPSSAQYTDAITGAIADLSRRAPLTRFATLAVVAGQASYALPADFLRIISLPSLQTPSGVIIGAQLIPFGPAFTERWAVAGHTLTFTPTPQYTLSRTLTYAAAYARSNDGTTYPDLTDDRAALVLLKAQATALLIQANRAALDGWKYTIDDETVDKTAVPAALQKQAALLQAQYDAALTALSGPVVRRGPG